MAQHPGSPWHAASYHSFLHRRLPALLSERLPLSRYHVDETGDTARVTLAVEGPSGEVTAAHELPCPDADGVFTLGGRRRVVVPLASSEELDTAEVRCVGEQLGDLVAARLSPAPEGLPWDEALLAAWLPLTAWVTEYLRTAPNAGELEATNVLARAAHLRRLIVAGKRLAMRPITASQLGRTCPFETTEGDNLGRLLHLAVGARIEDGRVLPAPGDPQAALGLSAAQVPFGEYDEATRRLMGTNLLRQWLTPPDEEPALVQTGCEPDTPGLWCGRNLLTAYLPLGLETFEDAIVISASAAARLGYPASLEPGDKLANRHGTKGTIHRIRPDDEMPHLPDGTPVDLVFNSIAFHCRMNFGQALEAVMGRVARAEGQAAIVPPHHGPSRSALREQLAATGLDDDGLLPLRDGRAGEPFGRPSLVGWVYWGKLVHQAGEKLRYAPGRGTPQREGVLEYQALRQLGAHGLLAEFSTLTAAGAGDGTALAEQLINGAVALPAPPSPRLARLTRRLAAAGIEAAWAGERLRFGFAEPTGECLALSEPVPHPWLPERTLSAVGVVDGRPEYRLLTEADERLRRLRDGGGPAELLATARASLAAAVERLVESLLCRGDLEPFGQVVFTGRAVAACGDLEPDQVGLPDELAWGLFGPLAARSVGRDAVAARTEAAAAALDAAMAAHWVVVHRAPAVELTSLQANRPVRHGDRVIRLHPLALYGLNADFDGDQVAVVLPLTEAGQRDAAEKLSLVGHLRRSRDVLWGLLPVQDALLGLVLHARTEAGRAELEAILGEPLPADVLTRGALHEALLRRLDRDGAEATLACSGRLARLGFAVVGRSGASFSPWIGLDLDLPEPPQTLDATLWARHLEAAGERLLARQDYDDPRHGLPLLTVRSGARGNLRQLVSFLHSPGPIAPAELPALAGHGVVQGLSVAEVAARAVTSRTALGEVNQRMADLIRELVKSREPQGFTVLARAMRATRPGLVFAQAAAQGEVDPLSDVDSRLFVGLPVA